LDKALSIILHPFPQSILDKYIHKYILNSSRVFTNWVNME